MSDESRAPNRGASRLPFIINIGAAQLASMISGSDWGPIKWLIALAVTAVGLLLAWWVWRRTERPDSVETLGQRVSAIQTVDGLNRFWERYEAIEKGDSSFRWTARKPRIPRSH